MYYRDNTHYFVMTAKKQSLLDKGVIINVSRRLFSFTYCNIRWCRLNYRRMFKTAMFVFYRITQRPKCC